MTILVIGAAARRAALLLRSTGFFIAVFSLVCFLFGALSMNWPSALGRIVSAKMTMATQSYKSKGVSARATYAPEVIYSYSVDGRHFTSSRVAFGSLPTAFSEGAWESGQGVLVYYWPDRPQTSVLVPGIQWTFCLFLLGIGLLCALLPELLSWVLRTIATSMPGHRP